MKPKRAVGASAGPSKPAAKPKAKAGAVRQRLEPSPEMRMWQRVGWILTGVVLVAAFVAWWAASRKIENIASLAVGVEAAAFAGFIWITLGPMRRARAVASQQQAKGKKPAEKPETKPNDASEGKGE